MNEGRSGALFPLILLGAGGFFALASILLTEGNTIGEFCRYLLVGGFLLSVVAPRVGFYTWLTLCGYNDLLKRLMIMGGRVSHEDLKYVLGITPAMFGGVVVALAVGGLLGTRRLMFRDLVAILAGCVLMVATGALAYLKEHSGLNGVLQAMANNGLYALLLFVLPLLYRSVEDLQRLWRFLVIIFLPVAIYGVIQQVQGFAEFEVDYLKTGLSIEVKQLVAGEVRAFSTLNSPSALSVVCATLAVVSLFLGFAHRGKDSRPVLRPSVALICFGIHFAGLIAATSRTPILIVPIALMGGWCFFSNVRTRVFYVLAVGSFLALVVASPWLVQRMDFLNEFIGGLAPRDSFIGRMIIVGTYWDRLEGFATVLMNPDAYTLLGWGIDEHGEGRFHFHDPLSEILVRFGSLLLLFLIVVGIWFLRLSHRQAWDLNEDADRQFAARMIALAFAIVAVSIISGSILSVFPNNVFFWLCLAGVAALARQQAMSEKLQREKAASRPITSPLLPPGHIRPRFRRSGIHS
ncbi:hypothetical protein EI77_01870 [Prosthecobacter fusiformis]|uniref:O-antigen ligase n=1 Tax=Prosthecobacter fusiformis TaxID=48464 RepID=A0A4R7S4N7_9BACT|nr:hypothetical protein [Prosthecobacter fusiformis]TDU73400.1 hypothetical protein EI77_01870 [Prosthecobacter fusiformis]